MGKKVLAADVDTMSLEFIRIVLTQAGYDVTCVDGGQAAIDMLMHETFACVILELYMPGKDSLDVINAMYKRKDRTPAIVVSSKMDKYYEAAVQGFGIVREILRKPCTAQRLVETVNRVLESN